MKKFICVLVVLCMCLVGCGKSEVSGLSTPNVVTDKGESGVSNKDTAIKEELNEVEVEVSSTDNFADAEHFETVEERYAYNFDYAINFINSCFTDTTLYTEANSSRTEVYSVSLDDINPQEYYILYSFGDLDKCTDYDIKLFGSELDLSSLTISTFTDAGFRLKTILSDDKLDNRKCSLIYVTSTYEDEIAKLKDAILSPSTDANDLFGLSLDLDMLEDKCLNISLRLDSDTVYKYEDILSEGNITSSELLGSNLRSLTLVRTTIDPADEWYQTFLDTDILTISGMGFGNTPEEIVKVLGEPSCFMFSNTIDAAYIGYFCDNSTLITFRFDNGTKYGGWKCKGVSLDFNVDNSYSINGDSVFADIMLDHSRVLK